MEISNKYDTVVVGTGPGGGTVAKELSNMGQNVLIVEYGPKLKKTGSFGWGYLVREGKSAGW